MRGARNLDKELGGLGGKIRDLLRKKNPIVNYCLNPIKLIYDKTHSENVQTGYGMWYGNDTIWRSIIDFNRIFFTVLKTAELWNLTGKRYPRCIML